MGDGAKRTRGDGVTTTRLPTRAPRRIHALGADCRPSGPIAAQSQVSQTASRARQSARWARSAWAGDWRRRRLGDGVGHGPQLGIVVRVGAPPRTASGGARPARAAGVASRKPQIVNATVRSWTTGARPNSDARFERHRHAAGERRRPGARPRRGRACRRTAGRASDVALVGTGRAQAALVGWTTSPTTSPGRSASHSSGRRGGDAYDRGWSVGLTGTYSGAAIGAATYSVGVEQAVDERVLEGLPGGLDHVLADADGRPGLRRRWSSR